MAPRDAFLSAMRRVASTVTVVTTDGPSGRAGATVSAFSSLSADPPSVLVCLRTGSRIERAVTGNGCFCVNILSEDAEDIARRFAARQGSAPSDHFAGLGLTATPEGPLLDRATAFTCTLADRLIHGSHAICIGTVTGISDAGERPLTYMQGDFHVVRPKMSDP